MNNYKRIFKYVKPYLKQLITANIFTVLTVIFSLLSVMMIFPFMDLLFSEKAQTVSDKEVTSVFDLKDLIIVYFAKIVAQYDRLDVLKYLCALIFITFLLKNLFSYLQTYFMSAVEQGILKDIRKDLYNHYLDLPLSFYTDERKGNLISRIINDVQIIKDSLIAVLNSLFRDPPTIITFSVVLFLFNWKLTLIIFLMAPVTAFILSKIGNSLKRSSHKSQEKISDITATLDETLGAVRVVKAFGMEEYEKQKFERENQSYFELLVKIFRKRALASPVSEIIGVITIVIILYIFGTDIINGSSDMTPGAFIFYLAVFFQMMPSLKLFGQMFNSYKEGSAASERVFKLLDTKPDIVNLPDAETLDEFRSSIEFRDVSFNYEKSGMILKDINLRIDKGKIIAIVGPSGAGKSTLVDLIPRFYDAVSGSLLIDGKEIKSLTIKSIRDKMGIVTQETILFNDTIRNNIAYGMKDIPEEKIIEAAKAANAHIFIDKLDSGYDTIIGDRGVKLSGGERQRLSIARALLKNPPILILDEATSSLDTESEILVQQAIERLMHGRTSVVIAHRLSTVRNANLIVVLNKGMIAETGTHDELILNDNIYRKLYNLQFRHQELNL
ncbi:MAG TPA: ABC transporter ATP-binding protein [Ignavibacteria bacterium]|nr:ABC transporter ATP-binding protein [Bacteroidota bacterium]HRI85085.1 ABC transporter ATP-binding protein [Ignavibacteria bacterium]HRJ98006.1 ABC transporter ATP-binding protein [Ignavibacteria bacterium]